MLEDSVLRAYNAGMSLKEVEFTVSDDELPPSVAAFLDEAEERIRTFQEELRGATIPAFVPSDFKMVYQALAAVKERNLAPGTLFLEWGSGFGVVAGLAALLGFDSHAIEINHDLMDGAEALSDDFGYQVEFARGTFVPEGGDGYLDQTNEFEWLSPGGACGYESLGLEADDFDVIFAYPWPGEEIVVENLFDRFGAEGALLVTYHGIEELRIRRKVGRFSGGGGR